MIRRWLNICGWVLLLLFKDRVVAETFTLRLLAVLASRMCFVALEDCGPVMSVDEVCDKREWQMREMRGWWGSVKGPAQRDRATRASGAGSTEPLRYCHARPEGNDVSCSNDRRVMHNERPGDLQILPYATAKSSPSSACDLFCAQRSTHCRICRAQAGPTLGGL